PTTVNAAKPRTRPPFTTLVTRLIATIFSRSPSLRSSPVCILDACSFAMRFPSGFGRLPADYSDYSELEPGLARGVRQSLDSAVVAVAAAVECNRLYAE